MATSEHQGESTRLGVSNAIAEAHFLPCLLLPARGSGESLSTRARSVSIVLRSDPRLIFSRKSNSVVARVRGHTVHIVIALY
jgi:hypothetical protein